MGSQNVARALLVRCSPRAKVVLVTMALHSLDPGTSTTTPLHYYAGWPVLAIALGYHEYGPVPERAVARCVAELVDKGVVKPVDRTSTGTTVYALVALP